MFEVKLAKFFVYSICLVIAMALAPVAIVGALGIILAFVFMGL